MPDSTQLIWLFFSFSGRVNRAAYFLGGLFLLILQFFALYRFMQFEEGTAGSETWAFVFFVAVVVALFSNIALAAKRLHDFGKPAPFALLFVVAGVIMYIALGFIPGDPGPNRYGEQTNAPA